MLACQSADRMAQVPLEGHHPLFFRTVLQALLVHIHYPFHHLEAGDDEEDDIRVGRIKRVHSFAAYARKACARLHADIASLSDAELEAFHAQHLPSRASFLAFVRLRTFFSQCIESVIVLDRLLFLCEDRGVLEPQTTCAFDPLCSPRCFMHMARR